MIMALAKISLSGAGVTLTNLQTGKSFESGVVERISQCNHRVMRFVNYFIINNLRGFMVDSDLAGG